MGGTANVGRSVSWPVGETASATDFVRHFGQYASTSLKQPIYITQHGRVNWALVNARLMAQLENSTPDDRSDNARFDIILDSIATHVIILDESFEIVQMNAAARRHFQLSESQARSITFAAAFQGSIQAYLLEVCHRVRDTGDAEKFEIDSVRYPGRTLRIQVIPVPLGYIITADVISQTVQVRRAYAEASAAATASDITNLVGRGRVNIRGTITSVNHTLATLANTTIEKVMGLRLASLFVQDSRDAVRDALETLLTDGEPFSIDATLLDGNANKTRVKLGVGVERDSGSISGAAFVAIACG